MNKRNIIKKELKNIENKHKQSLDYKDQRKKTRKQFENIKWQNLNNKQKDDILKEIAITLGIIKE